MIDSDSRRTWLVAVTRRLARRSATTRITRCAPRPLPAPGSVTAIPDAHAYPESIIPSGDGWSRAPRKGRPDSGIRAACRCVARPDLVQRLRSTGNDTSRRVEMPPRRLPPGSRPRTNITSSC